MGGFHPPKVTRVSNTAQTCGMAFVSAGKLLEGGREARIVRVPDSQPAVPQSAEEKNAAVSATSRCRPGMPPG